MELKEKTPNPPPNTPPFPLNPLHGVERYTTYGGSGGAPELQESITWS